MESIKQEIVNNVYENGEQLITGPVLQEVLLDIVDDYNGKIRSGSVPQDLVGKTGSWDDAADWVEQNSSSVVLQSDLEGYATEQWVEDQGYLKEHQDISGLATTQSVNELSESVAQSIADIPEVDLSGYATTESVETLVNETSESVKEWVEAQRYLTSASLSGSVTEETVGFMINDATASVKEWVEDKNYATETYVSESIAGLDIPSTEGFATTESLNQLSESVANDFANLDIPDISGLATTESVSNLSESVAETIANLPQADLSGYLTTASYTADSASFDERINAITGSDLSRYATTESLNSLSESVANDFAGLDIPDVSGLATTESVNQLSESVAESFENLPEVDLSGYATTSSVNEATSSVKEWVQEQGYLTEHQDISGLATTESVNGLSQSVAESIENIDLSEYATTSSVESSISEATESVKEWVEAQRYLTTASLSGSVTEESVQYMINDATSSVKDWVGDQNYATETFVSESIAAIPGTDLTGYATEAWVQEQGYLTEHQDISGLATTESVNSLSESVAQDFENLDIPDVSGLATTESVSALSESVRSLGNQVNGFGEDLGTLNGTVAGLASTSSLNSLSESVATDLGLLDERVTEVEDNKVDEEGVYNVLAGTGLAESEYGEWIVYGAAKEDDLREVSSSLSASIAAITGSDLSGYATTESVSNLSESVAESIASIQVPDVSGFLPTSSYLVDSASFDQRIDSIVVPDVAGLATTESVNQLSSSFDERINNIITGSGVDLSGYATTESVNQLSESVAQDFENLDIPDVSGLATTASVNQLSESIAQTIEDLPEADLSGYVTTASYNTDSASFDERINAITGSDLSGYATTESLNALSESVYGYEIDNLWNAVNALEDAEIIAWDDENEEYTAVPLSESVSAISKSLVVVANKVGEKANAEDLTSLSESVAGDVADLSASIAAITSSGGGECLWQKGTGNLEYSLQPSGSEALGTAATKVGAIALGSGSKADGMFSVAEGWNTIASGEYSHAEGFKTTASETASHAEGYGTTASGQYSHAEGYSSRAIGVYSHAEGYNTSASNRYEHAQGRYNATASSQIFSVGVGYDASSRKNAISIITGSGEQSSASIYIYGVGTYDGTNPQPGVNDLATVISASSGGGSPVDLSGYATTQSVNQLSESVASDFANLDIPDVSGYATTSSLNSVSESLSASIAAITSSGGGSGDYLPLTGGTINNPEESNTTLTVAGVDGGGIDLGANNGPETEEGPTGDGESWIDLYGSSGEELIIHNRGFVEYNWENEGDYGYVSLNLPKIEGEDTLAVLGDITALSESVSQSIAAITSSGGGSGTDTDLRNYLFGVATQQVTGITGSVTNIFTSISQDSTLGFSDVPDEGRSLSITILNNAANTSTIILPESVVVGSDTFNLINNGVDGSGSMSIPAGEYGDIVVTRHGSDIYVRTSVNLDNINVDLSGYATTASLNSVSESISQSIADIPTADLSGYATTESVNTLSASFAETIDNIPAGSGSSGDYLPLTGGTLTGNLFVDGQSAIGVGSTNVGNRSLTVGNSSTSTQGGVFALAVGENCSTNVYGGVALGRETAVRDNGAFGTATGFRNRVTKMAGYAGGCLSTASGEFATAIGFGAEAAAKGQVVLGAFNVVDSNNGTGSYAVIFGNGKSSTWNQDNPGNVVRSNGLAIKWDGGIDINYSGSTITLQDKIAELEQGGGSPADLSGYATTESVNQLQTFLFGVGSASVDSLDCTITNLYCSESTSKTLGFLSVPEEGRTVAVDIQNLNTASIAVSIPNSYTVDQITYAGITNGTGNIATQTLTIPSGQHGNMVIMRRGTDLFIRTSITLTDYEAIFSRLASLEARVGALESSSNA